MAVDLSKLPAVLPPQVARVTADGKPTKWTIDWEGFQRHFFATTVVDLDTRITEVTATTDDNSAAITEEVQARTTADGALALRLDTVEAYAGDATASGQIYFAAKAAPGGAAAAYGLYLTAGDVFAGFEVLADSAGGASIAFAANDFKLTDSGTAQNVFNYTGGVFTFNVPVRVGTIDISTQAVTAPVAVSTTAGADKSNTAGWDTILSASATGASGYSALVSVDFEYRSEGGSGTLDGEFRIRRSDGAILYEGRLQPYADYLLVSLSRLDTSFNGAYTYSLDVNVTYTPISGSPYVRFRRRGILIDVRKR